MTDVLEDTLGESEGRTALDTIMRAEGRGGSVAIILLIVGICMALLGGSAGLSLLRQPWELDTDSPVVRSVDSECRPFTGGLFTIEVGGQRYTCGGSDTKCGDEAPAPIAYDPERPDRCRLAANVDRLGDYELLGVMVFFCGVLAGLAGGAYMLSERLKVAALVAADAPPRSAQIALLRRLSGLALIVAIVLGNGFALVFLLSVV